MDDLVARRPIAHIASVSELADWMYEATIEIEELRALLKITRIFVQNRFDATDDGADYELLCRIDAKVPHE